jgi:hypothetical protein
MSKKNAKPLLSKINKKYQLVIDFIIPGQVNIYETQYLKYMEHNT